MTRSAGAASAPPALFDPEFFPTPAPVIVRMLARVDRDAQYFLEPSAGRGDIALAIRNRDRYERFGRDRDVDCIELSPDLCAILVSHDLPIVGNDWLTYDGVCYYDAIVMNPPFSSGVAHLLRAWEFLHAGEIVCLLNAESLANPYTAERQRLAAIVAEHGSTEHLGQCFRDGDRPAEVSVVLVYLKKAAVEDRIPLWSTGTDEAPIGDLLEESNLPAVRDLLGNKVRFYDQANHHWFLACEHARKAATYLETNGISLRGSGKGDRYEEILARALTRDLGHSRAEFLRPHRRDAWLSVFEMMHFHRWLDKKQTDELIRDVSTHSHFPFTVENIKGTLQNVLAARRKLFEQSAWNVFSALTRYFQGNTNYHDGWKSNDAFKVNRRLVFPRGCHYERGPYGGFSAWRSADIDIYNDLDRVLAVIDHRDFEGVRTIGTAMHRGMEADRLRAQKVRSTYFDVRYFKKGTVHLTWLRYDLLEQFSLTAAAGRKWIGDGGGPAAEE